MSLHDLRHTGISYWLRHGKNIKRISRVAGHSDVSITMRIYYNLLPEELDNVFDDSWTRIITSASSLTVMSAPATCMSGSSIWTTRMTLTSATLPSTSQHCCRFTPRLMILWTTVCVTGSKESAQGESAIGRFRAESLVTLRYGSQAFC